MAFVMRSDRIAEFCAPRSEPVLVSAGIMVVRVVENNWTIVLALATHLWVNFHVSWHWKAIAVVVRTNPMLGLPWIDVANRPFRNLTAALSRDYVRVGDFTLTILGIAQRAGSRLATV